MRNLATLLILVAGCGNVDGPVTIDPTEASSSADGKADGLSTALPDIRCSGSPSPGAKGSWRHWTSAVTAALGAPRHRGIDLVATASTNPQTIQGEISYGVNDKALEDEWVQIYACRSSAWLYIGRALTDGEGRFSLTLTGASRMPIGEREFFVSVFGDRTSARFFGVVAPVGAEVAVSDVDGTLTSSENAFPTSLVTGATVSAQASAAVAINTLHRRGYPIVYLTARGRTFTGDTRTWLANNGFTRGALRLAPTLVTLPGAATVDYKAGAMSSLPLPVTIGVGNRSTDIDAYSRVGVDGGRIFIKLPEFDSEVQSQLDAGAAVGFDSYAEINPVFSGL